MPDYKNMSDGEFAKEVGTDARKWAEAFMQIFPDTGLDEGIMIGWFANAIENGRDAGLAQQIPSRRAT